jgi:hypothetical protein
LRDVKIGSRAVVGAGSVVIRMLGWEGLWWGADEDCEEERRAKQDGEEAGQVGVVGNGV